MELKTFAEDDFDPKKWINNAWSSSGNQEKEVFVANTVSRLQLYMKQLTNSLDETTTQIATSLPRIVQDVSALQLEGELLQQKMLSLEQKFQSVEEQTGHSIESLQKIDQLKSRLENAASALREADKWAALATSLEDILETGVPTESDKLSELAKQVTAMTASLEVLSDAPDYESKRLQLETLYNRLEALISPPLIDALTQMDAERTRPYVCVFGGMWRGAAVARCWRRAAAARLAAAWRRQHQHHLHALTALLAGEAENQVEWLVVLKSETPLAELVRLYTDLLLSLDPAPTKVVSASLKLCSSAEEGVVMLTDLKRDIEEFVVSIKRVLDAPRQNKEVVPPATIRELGRAAYAPLRELLSKYTEMQTQLLLNNLKDPQLDQEDLLERSRALLSVSERCEGWLTTAYNGAKKIAGNAVYPYYIPAVEVFITALSSHISSHSRRIETVFLSSVTAGQITGVLSTTFPASLVLETATAVLLDALAQRQKAEREEEEVKDPSPLFDLPTLLLDSEGRQQLLTLRSEALPSVAGLRRAKEQLKTLARAILRNPVDVQLDKIPQLSVWCNNDALSTDLPDFALSPQEYITEIGQYLMTLPQHLEMHLSEKQAPWQFLSDVCTHTCEIYAEKILNIRNMDALGTKRCLTDIAYLSSVVEDLGTSVTPALKSLEKSLRAATPSQTTE
ncbi:conserved oligomeric Golgi complex subunit 7 [Manduca sexta]|uniref:conserved oligomeric Golgi complex subunit 7 n=1 Tax=Manduca sexta TaxID=7130 RepID=UPI00188E0D4E|nr:conserved oligomeric Golgi complex subunit 7 [Manduca sexta]